MNQERLLNVIQQPHVSEKSTIIADKYNQVVFQVIPNATKSEVKAAVETLFKVKVKYVQILNAKGKVKRVGQTMGKRKNRKKAYVSLHEGHDINFGSAE